MYVCLCNVLTERDILSAIAAGSRSVAALYKNLGCEPQCAKCVPEVCRLLRAENSGRPASAEAAVALGR
jgi:bacterioferritin-associated ferredoxin